MLKLDGLTAIQCYPVLKAKSSRSRYQRAIFSEGCGENLTHELVLFGIPCLVHALPQSLHLSSHEFGCFFVFFSFISIVPASALQAMNADANGTIRGIVINNVEKLCECNEPEKERGKVINYAWPQSLKKCFEHK